MSGYHNNKESFKKWFGKICSRNLHKKYNLKTKDTKEKMKIFLDFLNSMPEFLSKETFNEDNKLLQDILIYKSKNILVKNAKNKLLNLADLEKKIISFVLNYIPIRIQDSIKQAEKIKQDYPKSEDIYGYLLDFQIKTDRKTGDTLHFKINPKEWTYIFNQLFNEELKEQKFKTKSYRKSAGIILFSQEQHEEYSFWQFGDELVKAHVGYWIFNISSKGNVSIDFIIPEFIFESVKNYKDNLQLIDDFIDNINKINKNRINKVEKEWNIEDFEETEVFSEILESEIEASIISNPEILEEGLELIGNQYATSVGYIDILCIDKNENFVIVELKRGKGSHKVVGQIQKYMAWIIESLAKDKQVRGIIVVKEYNKELEYAIKHRFSSSVYVS